MIENVLEQRVDTELRSRIRVRAYELYETRGRVDGLDWQDWFHAERDTLDELNHPQEIAPCQREWPIAVLAQA
jgi:hypothetical protein